MDVENTNDNILKQGLKDFNEKKVWVTKKIRMDSEERMRTKNNLINYFLIYYSASLAVMSFLNLYESNGFNISLFASIISLILPSANIYQYKANYSKKEEEYRECYTELSNLESNINLYLVSSEIKADKVQEFKTEYENILKKYINHETIDYKLFLLKHGDSKLRDWEKFKLNFRKVMFNIFGFLLVVFPFLLIVIKIYLILK